MKLLLLFAFGVVFLSLNFVKRSKNNVCKTFEDYYTNRDNNKNCYYNPEYRLTVPEIIRRRGYPVEAHHATTKDGYILTLFRIPHGKNYTGEERQPIFMQHGIGQNSGVFVNTGKKSLAFILADAGYDVWLGNFRGTMYSRNHLHLSDTDKRFWNFSFHEMGIQDMPAQLDLVNEATQQKIIYLGYSMGTGTSYIYAVTYPETAQERLKILIGLAPAAIFREWKSVTKYLFPLWDYVEPIIQSLTNGVFVVRPFPSHQTRNLFCLPFPFQMHICQISDMVAWGFDYEQNDPETLPITLLHGSAADAISAKTMSHSIQIVRNGNFQYFDYGIEDNKNIYRTPEPPLYNLSKVIVPVYLVRGENDLLSTKQNVEALNASLPENVKPYDIYVVKYDKFNHGDFLMARDVVPLLYDHLVSFINKL